MITDPKSFAARLTRLDVKLPKAAADALDILEILDDTVNEDQAAIVARDAAAGRITAKTAREYLLDHAARLVAHERAKAARDQIAAPVHAQWRAAIRAGAPALLDALASRFDEQAPVVQQAGAAFPVDATPAQLVEAGPLAVELHGRLGAALDKLNAIRNVRVEIADYLGHAHEQNASWWITDAGDDIDRADRAYSAPGNAFHNLAAGGYTLRLNDHDEAADVREGARLAAEKADKANEDERIAKALEGWGPTQDFLLHLREENRKAAAAAA